MEATNVTWHEGHVARAERAGLTTGAGATLWFTGLSGSGKSTVASAVEHELVGSGRAAYRLDGDNLRTGLNADLGFGREARVENVRRAAEVAALMADAGLVVVVALISPYAAGREAARDLHRRAGLPFFEIFMAATVEECAARDPKGLYARVAQGEIGSFTGVDDPYEPPERPDLRLDADRAVPDAVAAVLGLLGAGGGPPGAAP